MVNPPAYFPSHILPPTIRDAVFEVATNVKAPIALITSSALGAISLACQGLIDVQRPRGLVGPVSLFLITVAESGERKSSCDKEFMAPITLFEEQAKQQAEKALEQYNADLLIWEIKTKALTRQILKLEQKEAADACES